jgi:hypothetical protein
MQWKEVMSLSFFRELLDMPKDSIKGNSQKLYGSTLEIRVRICHL